MAMTVEELQVLISANTDQFKGELLTIRKELQGLTGAGNRTGSALKSGLFSNILQANIATQVLQGSITRLTRGVSSLVSGIIEGGSAYARLTIATDTITANLGMTRVQVQGLRDDLADANTYGINAENVIRTLALSGLVDLADGLKFVDARSGDVETGITALTLAMKDLSAATAVDSSVGIESLARFIRSGEQTEATREMLAGISSLNQEYESYGSEVLGVTRQLTAQEQAQARLNLVTREAQKVIGSYANTYQTSGKAIASIRDITQSLAQMIGRTLEPILRVGTNAILQFFVSIRTFLGDSEQKIGSFANRVAGYMVALIRVIGRLLMRLPLIGKYFENLANFTVKPIKLAGDLGNTMGGLSDSIDGTGSSMGSAADKAKKLKKELQGLAGFDEMNVLQRPDEEAGSGAGAAGGGISGGGIGGGESAGLGMIDGTEEILAFAEEAEGKFRDLWAAVQRLLKPFREIKIFGKSIGEVFLGIAKWVGIAYIAFKVVTGVIGIVVGVFTKLAGVVATVKGVFMTIGGILAGLSIPALVVVGVIVALVALFALLYARSEEFRGKINEIVQIFMQKIPLFTKALQPLKEAVGKILASAFSTLKDIALTLWEVALKPLTKFIIDNIVPAFSKAFDISIKVAEIFAKIGAVVLNTLSPVFTFLWNIIKTVFAAIGVIIQTAWNNVIKPIFIAVSQVITGLIIPVVKNLYNIWMDNFNKIRNVASTVLGFIVDKMKPIYNFIKEKLTPIVNAFKDVFSKVFGALSGVASSAWTHTKENIRKGINGIITMINNFIRNINTFIGAFDAIAAKIPNSTPITYRVQELSYLAKGGEVTGPTLAMLGEQGYREAVLPLERNTGWAEDVARLITESGGGGEGATVVVKLGEETIFEKFVDYTNNRSLMSNKQLFNI